MVESEMGLNKVLFIILQHILTIMTLPRKNVGHQPILKSRSTPTTIEVPLFGNKCLLMKIKSQNAKVKLADAKGFNKRTMIIGEFAGKKVREAKPLILGVYSYKRFLINHKVEFNDLDNNYIDL